MSEPFLGEIAMFGGNFAPRGWALCDGQLLPINSNQSLFALLGTIYGGDGRTTFALPDLRGRVPLHAGNGPGLSDKRLGQKGGAESTTLTSANMPSHNHTATLMARNEPASTGAAENNVLANTTEHVYSLNAPDATMHSGAITVGNTGNGQSFNNIQPFNTINFIIALAGVFPSRN